MEILYDPDDCLAGGGLRRESTSDDRRSVVTIGAYDGVHLGHRAIISEVIRRADGRGDASVVMTFDRHPAHVIRPDSAPLLLTTLDQKLELLESTGVDRVVVIRFDADRAQESAEDFVRKSLVSCLRTEEVVVGEDFHFGHQRKGNVALLAQMGAELGFTVVPHKLVGPNGRPARDDAQVSSTAIRRAISEGRIADANKMLGRRHELRGPVVPGDQRGRTLGFPTANVAVPNRMLMPADGIYAGWLRFTDGAAAELPAAIYVGKRPTFYDDEAMSLLEVHILDFDADIYGLDVSVIFDHMVRPDEKFSSVQELTEQLQIDCNKIRSSLPRASTIWS